MGILDKFKELFRKEKKEKIIQGVLVEDISKSKNKEIVKIMDYKSSHENLTPEYDRILNVLMLIHTLVDKSKQKKLSIRDAVNLKEYKKELYIFSKKNDVKVPEFSSFDDDEKTIELTSDDLEKYGEFSSFSEDEKTYYVTESDLRVFNFIDDEETLINVSDEDLEFFTELTCDGFLQKCTEGGKSEIDELVLEFSKFLKNKSNSSNLKRGNSDIVDTNNANGYPVPKISLDPSVVKAVKDAVKEVRIKKNAFDLDEFTLGLGENDDE